MPGDRDRAMMAGNRSHKPKGIKVLGSERKLQVEWNSGHVTQCSFGSLRKNCPCAECRTGRDNQAGQLLDETSGELQLRSDRELVIKNVKLIGNYALQLEWSDGHTHGIYAWEYLWDLCGPEDD